MKKRILSFLLALVMVLSVFPMTVLAEDGEGEVPESVNEVKSTELEEENEEKIQEEPESVEKTTEPGEDTAASVEDETELKALKSAPAKMLTTPVPNGVPTGAVAYVTDANGAVDAGEEGADGADDLGGGYYSTLAAAIAACPTDGTQATIKMLANHKILGDDNGNKGWTIAKEKDIVLDLNGFKVYQYVTASKAAAVIEVYGKLTVEDNSTAKTGVICNSIFDDVQVGDWWLETEDGKKVANYVTNIITNKGTFVLNSGTLQSNGESDICYAIDSASGSKTEIHGGDILAYGTAIRCAHGYYSGTNIDFSMDGGRAFAKYGAAIWVQLPNGYQTEDPPKSGQYRLCTLDELTKATGTYTISGGVIESETYYAMYDYSHGQAFGKSEEDRITYNISGGTFRAGGGYGLCLGYLGKKDAKGIEGAIFDPIVNVTGGRFIGTSGAVCSYSSDTSVTGGYFSHDVSTLVADGLYCVNNIHTTDQYSTDGKDVDVTAATTGLKFTIGTEPSFACKIVSKDGTTETPYNSFDAALKAVKTDETIVLLDDCKATTNYYLGYGADYPSYAGSYNASYGFTVDLNNNTLDVDAQNVFYTYSYKSKYLTFKNGTLDLNAYKAINIYWGVENFNLTFENVTVNEANNGVLYVQNNDGSYYQNTNVILNNAEFIRTGECTQPIQLIAGVTIEAKEGSTNKISGADFGIYTKNDVTFTGTGKVEINAESYGIYNDAAYSGYDMANSNPNLYISGGTAAIASYNSVNGGLKAGFYSTDVTDFCAGGYVCVFNTNEKTKEEYPYTVKAKTALTDADYVATVTTKSGATTSYTTLPAAITAANDGDTVTLLKDTMIDGDYVYTYDVDFTLDLGGKTVTNNSTYGFYFQKCDVTVKNGTVTGEGDAFYAYDGSTLTLNGVTAISTGDVAVVVEDATLNAADGSMNRIVSTADNTYGDGIEACGKATIGGTGTIIAEGMQSAVHVYGYEDYLGDKCPAELTVTNPNLFATCTGTGRNADRALYLSIEKGSGTTTKAVLYAGVYENDVEAYCAEGYGIVKLVNGLDGDETNYKDYYQVSERGLNLNQEPVTVEKGESGQSDTYKLGEKEITVDAGSGAGAVDSEKVIEQLNEMLDNDTVAKYMNTNVEKATNQNTSDIKEELKKKVGTDDDTDEGVTIKGNIDTATDISKKVEVDLTCATVQEIEKIAGETTSLTTVTETEWEVKPVATVTVTNSEGDSVTYKAVIPNDAITSPIGFCLPVNSNVQATSAELFHQADKEEGTQKTSCGIQPIKTDANGKKYIEYAASEFSFYSIVTMTNVSESAVAVIKTEDAEGNINYVGYDKLQDAVTAYEAPESGTKEIILLKDANENVDFGSKTLTLDLNGYVFKGASTNSTGVTVKNTVAAGESDVTLAATGVYANNVKAFVMDGYDTRTNTETATPAIVAGTTYNEVFNNDATEDYNPFTIEVITSTATDRDSTNDGWIVTGHPETVYATEGEALAQVGEGETVEKVKGVDVYAGDIVTVQVWVKGARFTNADVTLKWDATMFKNTTMASDLETGWLAGKETIGGKSVTTSWRFVQPKADGEYYHADYLLGEFTFEALKVNESIINNSEKNPGLFYVVSGGETPAKVIGSWGITQEGGTTYPVPNSNLKDDNAKILLMNSMTGSVEGNTALVYKGSNFPQPLLNPNYNSSKGWSAKVGGQEYTSATIEYAVLTPDNAALIGTQKKDGSGQLLYVQEDGSVKTTVTETPAKYTVEDFLTYGANAPTGQDAGTYKVYYRIKADGYQTVENSVDVIIAKQKVNLEWTAPAGFTGSGASFTGEYKPDGFSAPTAKFSNLDSGTTELTPGEIVWTTGPNADKSLKDVGIYTFTAKDQKNYEFNNPTCTVQVTGKEITGWTLTATGSTTDPKVGVMFRDGEAYSIGKLVIAEDASIVEDGEGGYKDAEGHPVTGVKIVYEYFENKYYEEGDQIPDGKHVGDEIWTVTTDPTNTPKYSELGIRKLRMTVTADNYEKLEKTVTFTIKNPSFKIEKTEYVAGYSLVLVYTNESGISFKYGKGDDAVQMYDLSIFGYRFNDSLYGNGTEQHVHVYGTIVKGDAELSKVFASNLAAQELHLPTGYENMMPDKEGYIGNEFVNDVNNKARDGEKKLVDIDDMTFVQSVYNVNAGNMNLINNIEIIFRCDVNRDKIVDTKDVNQSLTYYQTL